MRGRPPGPVGKCHWRGCTAPRKIGEFCEAHKKAFDYHGSHVPKKADYKPDPWDDYESWNNGNSWEPFT